MTDEKNIERLLAAFYNGDTTLEEEAVLLAFFKRENTDEKWQTDRELFLGLCNPTEIPLPVGVFERLESAIDKHITETILSKEYGRDASKFDSGKHIAETVFSKGKSYPTVRKIFISITGVAAAIALCVGLFFITEKDTQTPHVADTFTDPEEAAIAAEKVLVLVSSKLNEGLVPLEKAKESMDKTNEILNESFK